MVNTISKMLDQVKDDLPGLISNPVNNYLEKHPDFIWRQRELDPLSLMMMFITQIMHGNTAINNLRHLASMNATATAYCKARKRFPLALVKYVSQWIANQLVEVSDQAVRWHGHRIWRGDGTSFSMPDTVDLQKHFGQHSSQAPGCGFPISTTLVLCNAAGFILDVLALPLRSHDSANLARLYDKLRAGDILVYDRAGCSFAHLAILHGKKLHAIFHMHQRRIVNFRSGRKHAKQKQKHKRKGSVKSKFIKRLGKYDQLVRWFKSSDNPKWMTKKEYDALPDSLLVRELKYAVKRKGFRSKSVTLVTTLLDAQKYPASKLAEQYLGRWEIETNFRHIKQTMGMDVLKCKAVDGILKELAVFVLVYNLVRLVMLRASQRQKVPLDRISFIDALRWLCVVCHSSNNNNLVDLIVNPKRTDRIEPRVVKRRKDSYSRITKPRNVLRQNLENKRLTA